MEVLVALLLMSLLAVISYRGLVALSDARDHVMSAADRWREIDLFFTRFEQDVSLAVPRAVRHGSEARPAWLSIQDAAGLRRLEFSRLAAPDTDEGPRRTAYVVNEQNEIELWLWPALDSAATAVPVRYPIVGQVARISLRHLSKGKSWSVDWPVLAASASVPFAVEICVRLQSGEEITRIFPVGA